MSPRPGLVSSPITILRHAIATYLSDPLPGGAVLEGELGDDLAALTRRVVRVQPRRDPQPTQETRVPLHHLRFLIGISRMVISKLWILSLIRLMMTSRVVLLFTFEDCKTIQAYKINTV